MGLCGTVGWVDHNFLRSIPPGAPNEEGICFVEGCKVQGRTVLGKHHNWHTKGNPEILEKEPVPGYEESMKPPFSDDCSKQLPSGVWSPSPPWVILVILWQGISQFICSTQTYAPKDFRASCKSISQVSPEVVRHCFVSTLHTRYFTPSPVVGGLDKCRPFQGMNMDEPRHFTTV